MKQVDLCNLGGSGNEKTCQDWVNSEVFGKKTDASNKKHLGFDLIESNELLLLQRWHNLSSFILLVPEITDA